MPSDRAINELKRKRDEAADNEASALSAVADAEKQLGEARWIGTEIDREYYAAMWLRHGLKRCSS